VRASPERPGSSVEREVKLAAAPAFRLPDLTGLAEDVAPGPERDARLETTYYDTSDLRLARWGLSLRHRGGEGWTMKLPEGSNGPVLNRDEVTFEGPGRRPPEAAAALVQAYLRGASLEPVARLSTRRRVVPLLDGSGRQVAEVVDDEVSVLNGRRVAARFREVEVELRAGGDALLWPLLERLREAGAGLPDPTPKHVRALGPMALAPPDVAVRELPPDAPALDVIRNTLAAGAQLILRHDPGVRLGGDPEDVHQARVGTRRLRSNLRTFGPLLDEGWAEGLRQELGWLGGELGAMRDAEVLLERLRALAARLPAADARPAAALLGQLEMGIGAARGRLRQAMTSRRYLDLVDRLVEAAANPVLGEGAAEAAGRPAAEVLPGLVVKPWRRLRRAVRELSDAPPDEELHQVRIRAKRARYAAEAVAPAAGDPAARFAKLAAAVQTELGEHQDSVTAQAWLRTAARGVRRAFVAGELAAMEAARAEATRQTWRKAWKRLDNRRRRRWMTPAV
jgi:CHAD domain-containing protein